ncbi:MAG: hypothetical protein ABI903_01820 [Actinomycetota bacterium]
MNLIQSLATNGSTGAVIVLNGLERRLTNRERGDVPGWVLITLMTAGLVTILWSLAATQLTALFTQAMTSVTGP